MTNEEIAQEVYNKWYKTWAPTDQAYFRKHSYIEFHHGIGRNIRNEFKLWDRPPHEPELINGIDYSPNHPDAVSSWILQRVQGLANNDQP